MMISAQMAESLMQILQICQIRRSPSLQSLVPSLEPEPTQQSLVPSLDAEEDIEHLESFFPVGVGGKVALEAFLADLELPVVLKKLKKN